MATSILDNNLLNVFIAGNYFTSHFFMGGEKFDTPHPEGYLFGENMDLNFLGNRPVQVTKWNLRLKPFKSLTLCHPHTWVFVLFSTVSLCDASTTWACQDAEEFGEHQEGFFTSCQVYCEYSHGLKGLLVTSQCRVFTEIREPWQQTFAFLILQV